MCVRILTSVHGAVFYELKTRFSALSKDLSSSLVELLSIQWQLLDSESFSDRTDIEPSISAHHDCTWRTLIVLASAT